MRPATGMHSFSNFSPIGKCDRTVKNCDHDTLINDGISISMNGRGIISETVGMGSLVNLSFINKMTVSSVLLQSTTTLQANVSTSFYVILKLLQSMVR